MKESSRVRKAALSEVTSLLTLAQVVQAKLTNAGSVQRIAGYSKQNICERTERGELWVLEVCGVVIGSAFVEPVTPERLPQIVDWNAVPDGCSAWFLYGLVVHPEHQGEGWGRVLLDSICRQDKFRLPGTLLLDCWAGSTKLRHFYTDSGFDLHSVFPESGFEIAVFKRNFSGR